MKLLFSILVTIAYVNAHMSMVFPEPRDRKNGNFYAVWERNEPMNPNHPQICHGLDRDASIRPQNIFTAGQTITISLAGSASHGGGHCAFWYTTNESGKWKKIVDVIDCTLKHPFPVTLPRNIDADCANRCVFAWTWQPLWSGGCEIYSNCADIRVNGGIGDFKGPQISFQSLLSSCVRVNEASHVGTMFGPVSNRVSAAQPISSSSSLSDSINKCPKIDNGIIRGDRRCGSNYPKTRCDDEQCCSSSGWCGPFPDATTTETNQTYQVCDANGQNCIGGYSRTEAENAYCSNNQGDWRLKPDYCTSTSFASATVPSFFLLLALLLLAFFA